MPKPEGGTETGHTGNGYARITKINNATTDFAYTGNVQTFTAPENGTYRIELWGSQGGNINQYIGGKGAYTKGEITLTKGTQLYIYVGNFSTKKNVWTFKL